MAFVLSVFLTELKAQQFKVDTFYTDSSSTVLKKPNNVKYYNGNQPYAVIIMDSPTQDVLFPGKADSLIFKSSSGKIWIYMQEGEKDLYFRPNGYTETKVTFHEHSDVVRLKAGQVYKLIVSRPLNEPVKKNDLSSLDSFLIAVDMRWEEQKKKRNKRSRFNEDNRSIGVSGKYLFEDWPTNLSVHGAYVTNYVPIEIEATLGLKKSIGTYIYDNNGTIKDSYEYTSLRFTARSGYCIEIDKSKKFMLTPLGGLSYNVLFGCQMKSAGSMLVYAGENYSSANTGSKAKKCGNGGNALSFVGGLRLSYAINEKWLFHVTPEYNVSIWKDDNFNYISKSDDGVKVWADGFNISAGVILRWGN